MANNTQLNAGTGGDIISDDQITTLNGATIATGEKVQRVKPAFGVAGAAQDVTTANPLPTYQPLNSLNNPLYIKESDGSAALVGQKPNATSKPVTISSDQMFPAGFLRTTDEPRQVFYDPFDTAPDTTNLWNATSGNSGVGASVSGGVLSLGTGTVANGYARVLSIPTFKPTVPAWLGDSFAISLPDGATPTANAYRFWGLFSSPTTPTTTAPITDGVGFELTTAGKLQAVVWAAGVRSLVADLSSSGTGTQPIDASYHRYIIYVRTDKAYWYIDGLAAANLVATSSFQSPAVQTLATGILVIGGATPPASNTQVLCAGLAVWDTGKNATQLADGTYPWRKAQISSLGALSIKQSDTVVTATIDATVNGATASITLNGHGTVAFQNSGTHTATLAVEASVDGINFYSVYAYNPLLLPAPITSLPGTSYNGIWRVVTTGYQILRLRVNGSGASGSVSVTFVASVGSGNVQISTALPNGINAIGNVGLNAGASVAISQTTPGTTNLVQVGGSLPAGTNAIGTVTQQAITKGTQGTNGVTTQDLKDAGRSARTILLDSFAVAATAETLMTMSYSSDNAATGTGTSYTVTTGKRFRMQCFTVNIHTISGNTTAVNVIVRLRVNNSGAAVLTSPVQLVVPVQGVAAANMAGIPVDIPFPDGWEFIAGAGIGVTVACAGFVATTAAPKVDISIIGYEY